MNETRRRIREYKDRLPFMREQVFASAVLLLVAVSMVISATFAWTTLSVNPEVKSLATTLSTNGNLEIALSGTGGQRPADTAVGDGSGSVLETNLKWGNLINLSNESYGLDFLTLRPATLNTSSLSYSPLFAVNYGQDGRVEGYLTDFSFSNYNNEANVFDVFETVQYGVRAISSVKYSNAHAQNFYGKQLDKITASRNNAQAAFESIYTNTNYMNTVASLVSVHADITLNGGDVSCLVYMDNLLAMLNAFDKTTDLVGQTIVDIINLYLYDELANVGQSAAYESLSYDLDDLKKDNFNNSVVNKYSKTIPAVADYVKLAKAIAKIDKDIEKAQSNTDGDVLWKRDLQAVAEQLCNISTATVDGKTISEIAAMGKLDLLSFVSGTKKAVIKDGILKDMDQMLGGEFEVKGIKIKVTYIISMDLTADIVTDADVPFALATAYDEAYEFASSAANDDRGTPVAADTYAMAIDFWVRTNEKNALLMLEGEVKETAVTVLNSKGMAVSLYEYVKKTTVGNTVSEQPVQVYKEIVNGETVWYNATTHKQEDVGGTEPALKTYKTYEGVNRVWEELDNSNSEEYSKLLGGTSVTQGSGSCYIFYPESPEDQGQALHLLESMAVAFVSEDGKLLGEAKMDTGNAIEDGGRVIVPLKTSIQNKGEVTGKDEQGNDIVESYYITRLQQNEAKRITAIIYLEGKNLSNSDVLAAGSINGKLNIQFGLNKMDSKPMKNPELAEDSYEISLGMVNPNPTGADDVLVKSMKFDTYDQNTCKADLELMLIGMEASTIKGQFVAYINASQGARQKEFSMEYDPNDKIWRATVPFSGPGNFKLRSIQIDGVDILLPDDQHLSVLIEGIGVNSLFCEGWTGNTFSKMTADASYTQKMEIGLGSGDQNIHTVQGVFMGEGKSVTVDFRCMDPANQKYTGSATFVSGGTYTMTYVIIDGVYTSMNESLHKTIKLTLNLKTSISFGRPVDLTYKQLQEQLGAAQTDAEKQRIQKEMDDHMKLLYEGNGIPGDPMENGLKLAVDGKGNMSFVTDCLEPLIISVVCIISDDQGNVLTDLVDVELEYSAGGISNKLNADMQENKGASYYAGEFNLTANGSFSFRYLSFKVAGSDEVYTITSSGNAPKITAIQPAPMEYVKQPPSQGLVYELGLPAEDRVLEIKLKNAAAATLEVTLTNQKAATMSLLRAGEDENLVKVNPEDIVVGEPDQNNVTTFRIKLPSDGYWKIVGLQACNVFYDGVFYDSETWLDMTEMVIEDEIENTYVTEAYIKVEGQTPASGRYEGSFMTDNKVNGMKVSVLGYGNKPLEQVLEEVGIEAEVSFNLQYTTNLDTFKETYAPSSNDLPQTTFTVASTDEYGNITMENMNFLLPGTYHSTWSIQIDAKEDKYDYAAKTYSTDTENSSATQVKPAGFQIINADAITTPFAVVWKAPDLKITHVDNTETSFAVNVGTDGRNGYVGLSGVYNYREDYYANIYAITTAQNTHTYPNVTMQLGDMGSKSGVEAKLVLNSAAGSSYNVTYDFSPANGWTDSNTIGANRKNGSYTERALLGEQIAKSVQLTYSGISYTVPLKNEVVVKQDAKPVYLQYSVSVDGVAAPATVISKTGRSLTINLDSVRTWEETSESYTVQSTTTPVAGASSIVSVEQKNACGQVEGYINYTRQTRTYDEVRLVTTTVDTKTITQWTIDGQTYNTGARFTITGAHSATGVVGTVGTNVSERAATYVITETYDEKKDETDAASGSVVSSTYSSWTKTGEKTK